MLNFKNPGIITWFLALVSLITLGFSLACSSIGGKGLGNARQLPAESVSMDSASASDATSIESMDASRSQLNSKEFDTRVPSEMDPFGLMPLDWPGFIGLHPASRIAHSGIFGSGGYYLVTLISKDKATIPGVQTFHIESFATWESLQVQEEPSETTENATRLVIIAQRDGSWVKILSEEAPAGMLASLDNAEYWEDAVGSAPIVVRIFYSSVPPPG